MCLRGKGLQGRGEVVARVLSERVRERAERAGGDKFGHPFEAEVDDVGRSVRVKTEHEFGFAVGPLQVRELDMDRRVELFKLIDKRRQRLLLARFTPEMPEGNRRFGRRTVRITVNANACNTKHDNNIHRPLLNPEHRELLAV